MDNLHLTETEKGGTVRMQQDRLNEREALFRMDLPEIIEQVAWLDTVCYFIDDQYNGGLLSDIMPATCRS